jgi:hypothetical protein
MGMNHVVLQALSSRYLLLESMSNKSPAMSNDSFFFVVVQVQVEGVP